MSELVSTKPAQMIALPAPRVAIRVRAATMDDVPFMDALQKKTSKQVGFMPTKQFEGKINAGHVIVAEATGTDEGGGMRDEHVPAASSLISPPSSLRLGYLIGCDRYFKHDDVGIIYQINVVPEYRRSLVAATLLKAQFERSAYGCRLYCCWCAQDIEANRFWESMGFVPLAYRAGGRKRGMRDDGGGMREAVSSVHPSPLRPHPSSARTHIFWQKRIRSGDVTTPWWFPSQTTGGSIREDRLVLPIPPGMHWSDAKPMILPSEEVGGGQWAVGRDEKKAIASSSARSRPAARRSLPTSSRPLLAGAKFQFASAIATPTPAKVEKPKREPRKKVKNDPKLVAAARELRDRWLERVNEKPIALPCGKYDVTRTIEDRASVEVAPPKLLTAA